MGGKMSRDKGKRREREAAALMTQLTGVKWIRGVQRAGGPDAPDIRPDREATELHAEVKGVERFDMWGAINQSVDDAGPDRVPFVLHKASNKPWLIVLKFEDVMAFINETIDLQSKAEAG